MKIRALILAGFFVSTVLITLNSFTAKKPGKADDEGKKLFTTYCATCHMLPEPASLTKEVWRNHVLPVMASRMGIIYPNYDPLRGLSEEERAIVKKNNIIPEQPVLNNDEWQKLINYVIANAPDSVTRDESRLTRNSPMKQFVREDIQIDTRTPSLITGIKYNNADKTLWIGNYYNLVYKWDYTQGVTKTINPKPGS